jgi:hypothetical protein
MQLKMIKMPCTRFFFSFFLKKKSLLICDQPMVLAPCFENICSFYWGCLKVKAGVKTCGGCSIHNDRGLFGDPAMAIVGWEINDTYIHFLYNSIQPSFKFTIEFVGLSVNFINSIINLKIKCVKNVFISFLSWNIYIYIYSGSLEG